MISKSLIERIYDAASIQRWNDHVRPVELTELDKQAHKVVIAFVVGKYEELHRGQKIDWLHIIEGGLFEFLSRVIMTDIKPPVYYAMMKKKGEELKKWVLEQLGEDFRSLEGDMDERFESYLFNPEYATIEKRILKAAHYLATNWEFRIIYHSCPFVYGIEKTKEEIENQIEDHYDMIGVQKISLGKKSFGFIDLCGQLRFQKRWGQSPRIPQTSVLGHMLVVASLSYFCSNEIGACGQRKYNNFFGGLFHDLPEVLTRDIVTPVKTSVEGIQEIIEEYETLQLEERILPLLPKQWHGEMNYFLENQFDNRVIVDKEVATGISSDEMQVKYNDNEFSPIDGQLIKACDAFAAFIEASLSINHGIRSHHLKEGYEKLYSQYKGKKMAGIHFGQLFDYFST